MKFIDVSRAPTTMASNVQPSSNQPADELLDPNMADNFYSVYELREVLGKGISSVVHRCVRHDSGQEYAVKIIEVSREGADHDGLTLRQQVMREVRILKKVAGHKHIIELLEVFDMQSVVFLVFELCPKGELFDLMTDKVVLTHAMARRIMRQTLEALHHCHLMNVVHRDVKPENILLDEHFNVKLTDFGFARQIQAGDRLREVCGTPGYLAPEILNSGMLDPEQDPGYSFEVDLWACGVTLYTMLSGHPPFWHRNQYKLIRQITQGRYSFDMPEWKNVANETKDLVARLLTVDPKKRLTVEQALLHPEFAEFSHLRHYVNGHAEADSRAPCAERAKHEANKPRTQPRRHSFRLAGQVVRSLVRLQHQHSIHVPLSVARIQPYSVPELRGMIDSTAFRVYSHWVKRSEGQNRGALFEHSLRRDAKLSA